MCPQDIFWFQKLTHKMEVRARTVKVITEMVSQP